MRIFICVVFVLYIVNFWNWVVVNIELIIWDYLMSGEFRWYYLIKYMYILFFGIMYIKVFVICLFILSNLLGYSCICFCYYVFNIFYK